MNLGTETHALSLVLQIGAFPHCQVFLLQIAYDPTKPGILDVFLACIAKALTLQTKVKGASSKGMPSSVKLADCLNVG